MTMVPGSASHEEFPSIAPYILKENSLFFPLRFSKICNRTENKKDEVWKFANFPVFWSGSSISTIYVAKC